MTLFSSLILMTSHSMHEFGSSSVRFAPILHFHPLERYSLADPVEWASNATVLDRFLQPIGIKENQESNQLYYSLLTGLLNASSAQTKISMSGSGYDETNRSKARLFFNVLKHEPSGGWLINYNFFYGWNGCQNMVLSSAIGGPRDETIEFYLCPTGLHEGDLERLSLLICPSDERVHAAIFSQHNHDQLYNCSSSPSPCQFSEGHINVFSALNSHANYPSSSPDTVIAGLVHTFHGSADGVYLVDRLSDDGPKWMPSSPALLMKLPDIDDENGERPEYGSDDYWARYPGWWGARQQDTIMEPSLVCLSQSGSISKEIRCPMNEAGGIIRQSIGHPLFEPSLSYGDAGSLVDLPLPHLIDLHASDYLVDDPVSSGRRDQRSIIGDSSYSTGRGPMFRVWSRQWWEPEDPPVFRSPAAVNHWHIQPVLSCPYAMEEKAGRSFNADASWNVTALILLLSGSLTLPVLLITIVYLREQGRVMAYALVRNPAQDQEANATEISSDQQNVNSSPNHHLVIKSRRQLIIGAIGCASHIYGLVSSFEVLEEMMGLPWIFSLAAIAVSLPSALLLLLDLATHIKGHSRQRSQHLLIFHPNFRLLLLFLISSIALTAVAVKLTVLLGCRAAIEYELGENDPSSLSQLSKHRVLVNVVSVTILLVGQVDCAVVLMRAHAELVMIGAAIQTVIEMLPS